MEEVPTEEVNTESLVFMEDEEEDDDEYDEEYDYEEDEEDEDMIEIDTNASANTNANTDNLAGFEVVAVFGGLCGALVAFPIQILLPEKLSTPIIHYTTNALYQVLFCIYVAVGGVVWEAARLGKSVVGFPFWLLRKLFFQREEEQDYDAIEIDDDDDASEEVLDYFEEEEDDDGISDTEQTDEQEQLQPQPLPELQPHQRRTYAHQVTRLLSICYPYQTVEEIAAAVEDPLERHRPWDMYHALIAQRCANREAQDLAQERSRVLPHLTDMQLHRMATDLAIHGLASFLRRRAAFVGTNFVHFGVHDLLDYINLPHGQFTREGDPDNDPFPIRGCDADDLLARTLSHMQRVVYAQYELNASNPEGHRAILNPEPVGYQRLATQPPPPLQPPQQGNNQPTERLFMEDDDTHASSSSSSSSSDDEEDPEDSGWSTELPKVHPLAHKTTTQLIAMVKEKNEGMQRLKRKLDVNEEELREAKKYRRGMKEDSLEWLNETTAVMRVCVALAEENEKIRKAIPLCLSEDCQNPDCRTLANYKRPSNPTEIPVEEYSCANYRVNHKLYVEFQEKLERDNEMLRGYLTKSTDQCDLEALADRREIIDECD